MPGRLQRLRHRSGERSGICQACGRHVPASLLVECDVEGLRGYDICPYCLGGLRFAPSRQDLRDEQVLDVPDAIEDDDLPRGGSVYWR